MKIKQILFDFDPTESEKSTVVSLMAAKKSNADDIAKLLGITVEQLEEEYGQELQTEGSAIEIKILNSLVQKALAGNAQCMFYYLDNICGYKKSVTVESIDIANSSISRLLTIKEDIKENEKNGVN